MLVSRKVIRWSAVPLALAVSAGVLVATQPAGALVTPREGVWTMEITGGTAEFTSDHDLVTLRPNGSAFGLFSVRDNSLGVDFTLSETGRAYVSDWVPGLGNACGLFDDPTALDDYVYKCVPAEARFTLPRVIETRMRGTVEVRVGDDLTSTSSVVLRFTTDDALPPTAPLQLIALRPVATSTEFKSDVRWKPPANSGASEVTQYRVRLKRNDGSGSGWEIELVTRATRAVVTGLKPATAYLVEVSAENAEGVGPPARFDFRTPGPQERAWVVSLGDSFISGEGGRWAGNADVEDHSSIDALGRKAYWDTPTGEEIEDCHRSQSAMIHIGDVYSKNFACSGAVTGTVLTRDTFKPGVDFYGGGNDKFPEAYGQAVMLRDFALTHNVRMVVLSIGGNDMKFGDTIEACLSAFMAPTGSDCMDKESVTESFSTDRVRRAQAAIKRSITNVYDAMRSAGKRDGEWTLVSTLYPQPMATGPEMRYPEDLGVTDLDRQYEGGCGFSDRDATWANNAVLNLVNETVKAAGRDARAERPGLRLVTMDSSNAFKGRTLCHKDVKRIDDDDAYDEGGPKTWRERTAVNRAEWAVEIEISNFSETMQQESVHPNYWGQLALRNCLRQVWNNGNPVGGFCTRGRGLNERGEPNMSLKRVLTD